MDLTLHIDHDMAENAELFAKNNNKSVFQLVEEYLLSISSKSGIGYYKPLRSITKQLSGIIKLNKNVNSKELLTDALMEKYF